ncbi:beta-N-acetylhexosaminidase [Streptomyces sp. NPDC005805]|uniref:beta-N-acetylhexosaminidase n=1 Tax=Streptomyces sp. NPDC005805 TaxID=3157068 RepID=UPI0033F7629B
MSQPRPVIRRPRGPRLSRLLGSLLLVTAAAAASGATPSVAAPAPGGPVAAAEPVVRPLGAIVPVPASVEPGGAPFALTERTRIRTDGSRAARTVAEQLAAVLRPSTGYPLPLTERPSPGAVQLRLDPRERALGAEGYRLTSSPRGLTVTARTAAGLHFGAQTLRQQLPARVERDTRQPGPWRVAGGTVTDTPRFAYRGAMLDIARHFLTTGQVERYIDHLALYKINTLHLHLSDDQGWRIAIDSWPRLATYGGSTQVGGGPGGYWTKAQYRELVRYAAARHIEVVPEIDMPGHTNAALASYAELNCDGVAPPLYTGIEVGFSSLCVGKETTYDFVDDVIREIAALTPGRYLHIGGDEAHSTSDEDFVAFMARAQKTVAKYGKTVMGWHQLAGANPARGSVVQYWGLDRTPAAEKEKVAAAARNGSRIVLSPADRVYLDMKYDKNTELGLTWAGYIEVQRSYDWDPGSYLPGVPESAVAGVEAPLWTETISTNAHIDTMAFPRLPGVAELGWSPAATHDWADYRARLAAQGPRMEALGIGFHRSPQVPWPAPAG